SALVFSPVIMYTMLATKKDGSVVYSRWPICSYKLTPVDSAAIFVVSESGDSLSPKYAPATTAPATAARLTSIPAPTPIKATPIVPAEPQEVPVQIETTDVTRNAVISKNCGLIIFKP